MDAEGQQPTEHPPAENIGRLKNKDEDGKTVFVYREWSDALGKWEVKTMYEDGQEPHPMDVGICPDCGADMGEVSDASTVVCMECRSFHPIP